ncbi:hypothetical protein CK228_24865 [Mesorhizobium sp. WSM4312]|nr:hypothetical protein CK228_24865 [Mesorhizobium sp. WSM4312]PBC19373.1 hypothetical protein CK226_30120 [Mesorhizobium sp. WSM4311]
MSATWFHEHYPRTFSSRRPRARFITRCGICDYSIGILFSSGERALFCTNCDGGGPVRLEVHSLPPN